MLHIRDVTYTICFQVLLERRSRTDASSFNFLFSESMRKTQEAVRKCTLCFCCGASDTDHYGHEMLVSEIETLKRTLKQKESIIRELNDRLYIGSDKFREFVAQSHVTGSSAPANKQQVPDFGDDEGIHSNDSNDEHSPHSRAEAGAHASRVRAVSNGQLHSNYAEIDECAMTGARVARSNSDAFSDSSCESSHFESAQREFHTHRPSAFRDVTSSQHRNHDSARQYATWFKSRDLSTWLEKRRTDVYRHSGRSLPDRHRPHPVEHLPAHMHTAQHLPLSTQLHSTPTSQYNGHLQRHASHVNTGHQQNSPDPTYIPMTGSWRRSDQRHNSSAPVHSLNHNMRTSNANAMVSSQI